MKLKQALLPLVIAGLVTACIGGKRTTPSEESSSLKAAFGNKFLIGAALNNGKSPAKTLLPLPLPNITSTLSSRRTA